MRIRELTASETARLLTHAQVDDLPNGSIVRIKWSGGNEPHEYVLTELIRKSLRCVGTERYQDRVFLPERAGEGES